MGHEDNYNYCLLLSCPEEDCKLHVWWDGIREVRSSELWVNAEACRGFSMIAFCAEGVGIFRGATLGDHCHLSVPYVHPHAF